MTTEKKYCKRCGNAITFKTWEGHSGVCRECDEVLDRQDYMKMCREMCGGNLSEETCREMYREMYGEEYGEEYGE